MRVSQRGIRLLLVTVLGALVLLVAGDPACRPAQAAPEVLYNGIELPANWPPKPKDFSDQLQRAPYLQSPPKVIPIDVGRQLFVDDFLIAETNLKRTFPLPRWYEGNPVMKPDQPWELTGRAYAMPFSDAVLFDPQDRIFKLWYYMGNGRTGYATSKDGIRWVKPKLDVEPGTNICLKLSRDSNTIWLDPKPARPEERFKMAVYRGNFELYRSGDGIHWTKAGDGAKTGDRSSFFYNPFRDLWVFSIRSGGRLGRSRQYWETKDFFRFSQAAFEKGEVALWIASDNADWRRDDLLAKPQLYNLDCTAYESLMVGWFSIWRGDYRGKPPTEKAKELLAAGRPKQNSVCFGYSRDGFHWDRPDRRAVLPTSEKRGDWNWGNVQSTAPGCLIVNDELWIYVSGRAGKAFPDTAHIDSGASTGLAKLRRDGFASMDAAAASPGTLTTRPVSFKGKHLFVNLDAPHGELKVEVLDAEGSPIAPFDKKHCRPLRADATKQLVSWEGAQDLSAVAGKPVRFRFHLADGRLYSFWVTPDVGGASYGYVPGGPDFAGIKDVPAK